MEEQELALRCARKDRAAQRELYEEYRSRIHALCRRYAENPADAEDLMQDAFIKIFKVIGNFKWTRPGSLYSWMSRVSINLAFDTAKRRRRLASQLVDVDDLGEDIPEEPAYNETASVPSEVLNEMIESLPEGYRTIFRLYCIDGLSHREIGELLGIKEKSSSASLSRARAMLAEAIRQYWRYLDDDSSPEGWTLILRKMRRAEITRSITLILAIIISVTSLLLWQNPRQSQNYVEPYISEVAAEHPTVIIPHTLQSPRVLADRTTVITDAPSDIQDSIPDTYSDAPGISDSGSDGRDTIDPNEHDYSPPMNETFMGDDFPILPEKTRRSRPKVSFSLRSGSGSGRRNEKVTLESSPYIAAVTYMNTVDPSDRPSCISNSGNAIPWFDEYTSKSEEAANDAAEVVGNDAENHYRHNLPITFGLSARVDLNSRFGAECGIEYTYMHSSVETEKEKLSQTLHFIGIPVRFDTRILSWKGFDLYAGLGIKAEKCIAASLGQVKCEEISLQWSAGAFAGLQYSIGRRTHLYFQPDLSYYLTKTDLITYRTENPMMISLNAGVRFDL